MTTTLETAVDRDDTNPETWTYRLTPSEFAATVDKIEKINARAAKRGFTGSLAVEGERIQITTVDDFGFDRTEVFYETRVTGEAPKYNGWTFLARVDMVGDTFTLATAPGVDHVERSLVHPGVCDHCGHNRQRNNTYLVRSEQGEVRNVGSTCIKDFLGWNAGVVFFSEGDMEREISAMGGTGERTYSVDTILAYAFAATRAFGWVRSSDYNARPTAEWVRLGLGVIRPTKHDKSDLARLREFAAEATAKAATIREFILSDDFAGTSTYVDNLKVAAAQDGVTNRQIGLLASAPQAYVRHLETAVERAAKQAQWAKEKEAKQASDFIAEVGTKKVVVEGTISAIRYIEGDYGTTALYTVTTKDGNIVKWFSSNHGLGSEEGVEVKFHGTVKAHDEYNGVKSTVLTRCKVL